MPAQTLSDQLLTRMRPPRGSIGLDWRVPAFYVLVPLAFAAYGAMNNWQLIGSLGAVWAGAYYLGHAQLPWLATCALSTLAMRLLRPWQPRPVVIMLFGHVAACIVVLPYLNWLTGLFAARWPNLPIAAGFSSPLAASYWGYWLSAGLVWLAVNFLFDRFLGMPRYRYDTVRARDLTAPAEPAPAGALPAAAGRRPAFLERVPAAVSLADVLAVKAEQHYIKVVTAGKNYLVLHRFSDALVELSAADGLQVHRSWWVRRSGIQHVRQAARRMSVVLQTGEEIPVSGPYQALVRATARSSQ